MTGGLGLKTPASGILKMRLFIGFFIISFTHPLKDVSKASLKMSVCLRGAPGRQRMFWQLFSENIKRAGINSPPEAGRLKNPQCNGP